MDTNIEDNQSKPEEKYEKSYGKRPLWQWILIYVTIGIVVYGVVYYFFFASKSSVGLY